MNKAAATCWTAAALCATGGMAFGIMMSASGDHTLASAHAHLNLVGWTSLALYGTFYALVPRAGAGWLARVQIALAIVGVVLMVPGIVQAIRRTGETLVKMGSTVTIVAMILFLIIVLLNAWKSDSASA